MINLILQFIPSILITTSLRPTFTNTSIHTNNASSSLSSHTFASHSGNDSSPTKGFNFPKPYNRTFCRSPANIANPVQIDNSLPEAHLWQFAYCKTLQQLRTVVVEPEKKFHIGKVKTHSCNIQLVAQRLFPRKLASPNVLYTINLTSTNTNI